jgi:hypothetical protein
MREIINIPGISATLCISHRIGAACGSNHYIFAGVFGFICLGNLFVGLEGFENKKIRRMNAKSAYLSCFLIQIVPYNPKLANSNTRVSDPVLVPIQTPAESNKEYLEVRGGARWRNKTYRAVSVDDTGSSFEFPFWARLLVEFSCAGGSEVFSTKGTSSGGGGTTKSLLDNGQ